MAKSVYIETSIPSAYFDERADVISQFQRMETRRWFDEDAGRYSIMASEAVVAELGAAQFPAQQEALQWIRSFSILATTAEVQGVARTYVEERLMPKGDMGDAFHLAFASVHRLDYLLTWNCRHLANPNKVAHIVAVNRRLALITPIIVTPQMLVQEISDDTA